MELNCEAESGAHALTHGGGSRFREGLPVGWILVYLLSGTTRVN